MSDILLRTAVFYIVLFILWFVSLLLSVGTMWKRYGVFQSNEEIAENLKEFIASGHWIIRVNLFLYCVTFFYYCIPVTLYQRYVKHNMQASLIDPRGKYGVTDFL